jgi:hypothetical protein
MMFCHAICKRDELMYGKLIKYFSQILKKNSEEYNAKNVIKYYGKISWKKVNQPVRFQTGSR